MSIIKVYTADFALCSHERIMSAMTSDSAGVKGAGGWVSIALCLVNKKATNVSSKIGT